MLSPDVVKAVTGDSIPESDAIVKNYSRRTLKNRDYPGVIQCEGGMVVGKVLHGVREELIALIDRFEGDEYAKSIVRATLKDETELDAFTYVWNGPSADVNDEDWDFEYFRSHKLRKFLMQTRDIMNGKPLQESYDD